ncbi:hypothetical protein Tdes44962_MAKER05833 [Teratosphaeria destructans]|uniref:Uncharacterized protein n=1 Tax=Teratosphaeria destructans TaxID=418781 RepID=A0A9W7SJI8_9PEZI|nr:hypothetical protein Tdes44962_MAKER05833 [Teratosphaeria destructans]
MQRDLGLPEDNTLLCVAKRGVLLAGDHDFEIAGIHQMAVTFRAAAEAERSPKRFTSHRLSYQLFSTRTRPLSCGLYELPKRSVALTVCSAATIGDTSLSFQSHGLHGSVAVNRVVSISHPCTNLWHIAAENIDSCRCSFFRTKDEIEEAIFRAMHYLASGAFHRLLAGMSQLHTLKLDLTNVLTFGPNYATSPSIISARWTDELVGFVLRHRSCLRKISLSHITLTEGDCNSAFERTAGKCPRPSKVKLSGDFVSTAANQRWCMYRFAQSKEQKVATVINETLEAYVRDGGAFPNERELHIQERRQQDALGIAEEELVDPDPFEECEPMFSTFKPRTLVGKPEDDGGYDSDGSHISCGSDEFVWET